MTSEKDFMGVRRDTASSHDAASARVNKSHPTYAHVNRSHPTYEAAQYMRLIADPHIHSQNHSHALHMVESNMADAGDKHTTPLWFHSHNPTIRPSSTFVAADWRCGTVRQQLLRINNSQEQSLEKVSDNYVGHGGGFGNGIVLGLVDNSSRSRLKMFPFLAPIFHEPGLAVNVSQACREAGLYSHGPAHTPSCPSSSRVLSFDSCTKSSAAQLTVFYKGQVNVYDNVSSTKVEDIMLMAATGGSLSQQTNLSIQKCALPESRELLHIDLNTCESCQMGEKVGADLRPASTMQGDQSGSCIPCSNNNVVEELPVVPRALPQARKASLARFLVRRKERLMTRSPYSLGKSLTWMT